MRLLITGAAGFIGSNLVRWWRRDRPTDFVLGLDALTYAAVPANLDGLGVELVRGDIGDQALVDRLLAEHAVDTIVNCAAESHNSRAVLDPGGFFHTNVMGALVLLDAARRRGGVRFHQISTCEVYGDLALDEDRAFDELAPYRPQTPYSASKASADHAVRAYHNTFGLPTTITNSANNYGPYQFPEKSIPLFTTRALAGQPLPLFASTANRREWIHVADHCAAIAAVLDRGRPGETYNVGTGVEASIEEVADLVLDELALPASLKTIVPDRPGHDRRYLLDSGKIRRELGWAPQAEFAEGVRETVRWYKANPDWWQPLVDRARLAEPGRASVR